MKERKIGVIMNGVTGRMGTNQHLVRSILAIRRQGGVRISDAETIMPEPVLVGRNAAKLQKLCAEHGLARWSTDLDKELADKANRIYFDAQTTNLRVESVKKAIAAGKDIYCEKPTATDTASALELARLARKKKVKNGVVQDKLWLPGFLKLKTLVKQGYFGEILSVRGEFGYWVFEGDTVPAQRPSWNYRAEDGGGIIVDMVCHFRYVLAGILGQPESLSCLGATHVGRRVDEQGKPYTCTADDSAYVTFRLDNGIIAHFNSSWCVRVRRDDLLTLQVDGTKGSAVVGLRDVWLQPQAATPRPVWNPDVPNPLDFHAGWQKMPDTSPCDNAFKVQWELFLRHVELGEPFPWDLLEGAKGVQLAELALESWKRRAWVDVKELKA